MPFLDTIKLAFGNNLIMGNVPEKVTLEQVAETTPKQILEVESFGLFDTNTSNFNTYFPQVTAEDLQPKDEEFIEPVFRALSEVIVHKNWNPVDFSMNGVLRKSMGLLRGATINPDHEPGTGNALGAVSNVAWQDSYKTEGGIVIPAGINAKLKIDGKSNPKVARGIMMDPPAIHSTSVTVGFFWEKSHPELSDDEFFSQLGKLDKDKKLIRRIATKVKNYPEISLVHHGADPFAQLIKDGGIVNPKWADVTYNSFTGDVKKKAKIYVFDFKTDIISNSIPEESNNNPPSHNTDNFMNKQFLIALAAILGVKLSNEDPETEAVQADIDLVQNAVSTNISQVADLNNTVSARDAEITRLQAIETRYNTESANFAGATQLQAFKDTQTEKLRTQVQTSYNMLMDGKPQAAMADLIKNANYETLAALNIQYQTQLDEKFPVSCKECQSTNVSRASAKQDDGNPGDQGTGKLTKRRTSLGIKTMHEEVK